MYNIIIFMDYAWKFVRDKYFCLLKWWITKVLQLWQKHSKLCKLIAIDEKRR
jgi:hypothetical protein